MFPQKILVTSQSGERLLPRPIQMFPTPQTSSAQRVLSERLFALQRARMEWVFLFGADVAATVVKGQFKPELFETMIYAQWNPKTPFLRRMAEYEGALFAQRLAARNAEISHIKALLDKASSKAVINTRALVLAKDAVEQRELSEELTNKCNALLLEIRLFEFGNTK